mmetsp:Transcript_69880/g.134810  ORF Transcript_69880/g.134810 Transcript_69880/m.134810 type:complete len:409 (-) Transcript_69880:359-1585(-)
MAMSSLWSCNKAFAQLSPNKNRTSAPPWTLPRRRTFVRPSQNICGRGTKRKWSSLHRLEQKCSSRPSVTAPVFFEIDATGSSAAPRAVKGVSVKAELFDADIDVAGVTKILRRIPAMNKTRATLESVKTFRMFSMRSFRQALSEAEQSEMDDFAEALNSAARFFTKKQMEQIADWTGLVISGPTREDFDGKDNEDNERPLDEDGGEGLEEQLAELKEELDNPMAAAERKRKKAQAAVAAAVKQEAFDEEGSGLVARTRPDWKGRAAPETPAAAAARQWVANRQRQQQGAEYGYRAPSKGGCKGRGKGWGKGGPRQWRSLGIVSLDGANSIHGAGAGEYEFRQHARYSDQNKFMPAKREAGIEEDAAEEDDQAEQPPKKRGFAAPPKMAKGTPTLAPMCPAPSDTPEDL